MIIKCPHCQKRFNAPKHYKDKKVKCPNCSQAFVVTSEGMKPKLPDPPIEAKPQTQNVMEKASYKLANSTAEKYDERTF